MGATEKESPRELALARWYSHLGIIHRVEALGVHGAGGPDVEQGRLAAKLFGRRSRGSIAFGPADYEASRRLAQYGKSRRVNEPR